jgi:17beta-estradiol 17-dehydrogenase / very-long-chain 3-oxoacyl-CoA reductase
MITIRIHVLLIIIISVIIAYFLIEMTLLTVNTIRAFKKYFCTRELKLLDRYGGPGTWAIITGASSGQGRDFALSLAKRGFNICMIGSHNTDKTATEIATAYPVIKTKIIYKDFCCAFQDDFFDDIIETINELDDKIGLLVNNVGHRIAWNPYHEMPHKLIRDSIATGTIVQSRLTQLLIPIFLKRKPTAKSGLINITAQCLHPNFLFGLTISNEISVPYLSVYEAANAFGFYHGNSIYKEYKGEFDILNVTPGAVITENTQCLKNTMFKINSDKYVENILKMTGNVQGHSCAYWGHALTNFLINLVPFIKNRELDNVGRTISIDYMNKYMEKYKSIQQAPNQTKSQQAPDQTPQTQTDQPHHDEYQTQLMKSLLESLQKTLLVSKDTLENKPAVYPETPSESIIIEDTPLQSTSINLEQHDLL